jgi:hypothetical protein
VLFSFFCFSFIVAFMFPEVFSIDPSPQHSLSQHSSRTSMAFLRWLWHSISFLFHTFPVSFFCFAFRFFLFGQKTFRDRFLVRGKNIFFLLLLPSELTTLRSDLHVKCPCSGQIDEENQTKVFNNRKNKYHPSLWLSLNFSYCVDHDSAPDASRCLPR